MNNNSNKDIPPELQELIQKKRAEMFARNSKPVDDFAGLTPAQMYVLINDPWESPQSPIDPQLATEDMVETSILCQGMLTALDYFSSEKGEKLTRQGKWPRKLLLKLYELGDADPRSFDRIPRLEEDWPMASALHGMLVHARLLRKSKDKMIITKSGKNLLGNLAAALEWIDISYTQSFNWAYLDGYPEVSRYQQHWGFMVWLLLKFGKEERPVSFYVAAFLKAWPMFLDELPEDQEEGRRERRFRNIFELRYIKRGFAWLGWVDYRYEGKGFNSEVVLKASPAFYKRWSVSAC